MIAIAFVVLYAVMMVVTWIVNLSMLVVVTDPVRIFLNGLVWPLGLPMILFIWWWER
jgi:hypothetical protein